MGQVYVWTEHPEVSRLDVVPPITVHFLQQSHFAASESEVIREEKRCEERRRHSCAKDQNDEMMGELRLVEALYKTSAFRSIPTTVRTSVISYSSLKLTLRTHSGHGDICWLDHVVSPPG